MQSSGGKQIITTEYLKTTRQFIRMKRIVLILHSIQMTLDVPVNITQSECNVEFVLRKVTMSGTQQHTYGCTDFEAVIWGQTDNNARNFNKYMSFFPDVKEY